MLRFSFSLFFLVFLGVQAHSQSVVRIGGGLILDNSGDAFQPGFGLSLEKKVNKRLGIESGLYYRNHLTTGQLTINSPDVWGTFRFEVAERHLNMPILFKFHTGILNFSIGPSFDFYMGWKHRNKTSNFEITSYSIDPDLGLGVMAKISRSVKLNSSFFIEPELRINPVLNADRLYAGFGIIGRYQLK